MIEYLHKSDVAIGGAAATYPWWVQLLENVSHAYIVVGGVVLVTVRVAIAIRDWRRR
jgi:hypothetical protein